MAAVIILITKKNDNIKKFIPVIDEYLKSQGFLIIDNSNNLADPTRTYFYKNSIPPTTIRQITLTIKNTNYYSACISDIYFTPNLSKA